MDAWEIAGGWLNGYDELPYPAVPARPREVLDSLLLRHLTREPCLVAFSGGRDSSAVLAAAVAAARREGLPLPVPVTLTYPGSPDTDEQYWQRAVLEHLKLTERLELTVAAEHDPIGPVMRPLLREHGLLWPPNLAPTWRMMDLGRGGVLLTGEGGDEVFGLKRITPLTKLLATRGRTTRRVYARTARELAPAWLRRRAALRNRYRRPWLRPEADGELAVRDAADAVASSLHAGRHGWQLTTRRSALRGYETVRALGEQLDVTYVQVFAELDVVAAVGAAAGRLGWSGRTSAMVDLFGDVLPREVLERSTKAVFTNAVFTEHSRAFAREWTGEGVEGELAELVDLQALRANWLSGAPHAPSMNLLQQAWLATAGVTAR
ncbi:MAG: asparagine synthase-related protein [Thermocrispum sp.]